MSRIVHISLSIVFVTGIIGCITAPPSPAPPPASVVRDQGTQSVKYIHALANGKLANEGFRRCTMYVHGWLGMADPITGLIPRNNRELFWNAKDAAADNYPFMVLSCALTDRAMFEGRMRKMLDTEIKITSRIDRLPDTYLFRKKGAVYYGKMHVPAFNYYGYNLLYGNRAVRTVLGNKQLTMGWSINMF